MPSPAGSAAAAPAATFPARVAPIPGRMPEQHRSEAAGPVRAFVEQPPQQQLRRFGQVAAADRFATSVAIGMAVDANQATPADRRAALKANVHGERPSQAVSEVETSERSQQHDRGGGPGTAQREPCCEERGRCGRDRSVQVDVPQVDGRQRRFNRHPGGIASLGAADTAQPVEAPVACVLHRGVRARIVAQGRQDDAQVVVRLETAGVDGCGPFVMPASAARIPFKETGAPHVGLEHGRGKPAHRGRLAEPVRGGVRSTAS